MIWVVQRDVRRGDIVQLNILVQRVIIRDPIHDDVPRPIMNLADHNRADQRTGVARAQSGRQLRRELIVPRAVDISPK